MKRVRQIIGKFKDFFDLRTWIDAQIVFDLPQLWQDMEWLKKMGTSKVAPSVTMIGHMNGDMKQLSSLDFREKGWTIVWNCWTMFGLRAKDMVGNEDEIHEEGENETTKEDAPYLID